MTISTIHILAASDWDVVIKVVSAVFVLAAGAIGSYIKSNSDSTQTTDEEIPREKAEKPRRVQPQYPTAQPMPEVATSRPVIVQREEVRPRPVVTRPTAPPVIAHSPVPVPTIRRTPAPIQRKTPQPVSRADSPLQSQKRVTAKPKLRVEPVVQARSKVEQRQDSSTEKRNRFRPESRLKPQLAGDVVTESRPIRAARETLHLASKENLRNAIVLSEILGPPLGLRPVDEPLW